jgi:hypothetical protein
MVLQGQTAQIPQRQVVVVATEGMRMSSTPPIVMMNQVMAVLA